MKRDYKYYGAQTDSIDRLKIDFGGGTFLLDDLAVTRVSANVISPVPEPSSIALMLGGIGLVGFMAARRRTKKT